MNRRRAVFLWEGQANGGRGAHNKEGGARQNARFRTDFGLFLGENG